MAKKRLGTVGLILKLKAMVPKIFPDSIQGIDQMFKPINDCAASAQIFVPSVSHVVSL